MEAASCSVNCARSGASRHLVGLSTSGAIFSALLDDAANIVGASTCKAEPWALHPRLKVEKKACRHCRISRSAERTSLNDARGDAPRKRRESVLHNDSAQYMIELLQDSHGRAGGLHLPKDHHHKGLRQAREGRAEVQRNKGRKVSACSGGFECARAATSSSRMLTPKFLLGMKPLCDRGARSMSSWLNWMSTVAVITFASVFRGPRNRTAPGGRERPVARESSTSPPLAAQAV
eukprot:2929983-Pyramimonas_sp.AAC.3